MKVQLTGDPKRDELNINKALDELRKSSTTVVNSLVNSTGASADTTIAAVSGSGDDATINSNFADLAEKINEIRNVLIDRGLIKKT